MQEHGAGVDLSCNCVNGENGGLRDELILFSSGCQDGSFHMVGS
jgi:hypothetical protein